MKKGDDKWFGPCKITAVYKRACAVELPRGVNVFPVFHTSFLRPYEESRGLPGQDRINEAESRHLRGRILERTDGAEEVVEKWEFSSLLDCHNDDGLHYLVKWRYHAPTWQPAIDLKGQDRALLEFHAANPEKPGPPTWCKKPRTREPVAAQAESRRRSPRLRSRRVTFALTQFAH